jgi:hypothetical protein
MPLDRFKQRYKYVSIRSKYFNIFGNIVYVTQNMKLNSVLETAIMDRTEEDLENLTKLKDAYSKLKYSKMTSKEWMNEYKKKQIEEL